MLFVAYIAVCYSRMTKAEFNRFNMATAGPAKQFLWRKSLTATYEVAVYAHQINGKELFGNNFECRKQFIPPTVVVIFV